MSVEYARLITKGGNGTATVPPSPSHENGDWSSTDIYELELYIDVDTGKIYTRTASGVIDPVSIGSINIYNADGALTGNRLVDQDGNSLTFQNGDFAVMNNGSTFNINNGYIELANVQGVSNNVTMVSVAGGFNNYLVINSAKGINTGQLITGSHGTNMLYLNGTTLKASNIGVDDAGNASVSSSDGSVTHKINVTDIGATISFNGITYVAFRGAAHASSTLDIISTTQGTRTAPPMTEAQMNAITSPVTGLEVFNTTRDSRMYYHSFFGWINSGVIIPEFGYEATDECTAVSGDFFQYGATNGGTLASVLDVTKSPVRILGLSTGVNANGEERFSSPIYFVGSMGKKQYKTYVAVDTLSDATNRYVALCGIMSAVNGLSAVDGMYFIYDEGGVFATATASVNLLCVCRNGASQTIYNTGIPMTTLTASALKTLEVKDYGTGNKVEFLIGGVLVHTETTTAAIPDNTKTLSYCNRIMKQAGTTARILYMDYVKAKEKFNTPR